jgi:hypothetical protein
MTLFSANLYYHEWREGCPAENQPKTVEIAGLKQFI